MLTALSGRLYFQYFFFVNDGCLMVLLFISPGLIFFVAVANGLYEGNSDVVELTASNFQSKVIDSDSLWVVEFFAPWYHYWLLHLISTVLVDRIYYYRCGHCQQLTPEYIKAAKALKVCSIYSSTSG